MAHFPTPTPPENTLIVGRFASVYGVRGWIKVVSFTEPMDKLLDHSEWLVYHKKQWTKLSIEAGKVHGKFLAIKIEGLDDRDLARAYTNDFLALSRESLGELQSDEFYWEDLIGLSVVNQDGKTLGRISSLIETGANDVIVVQSDEDQEILIPYLDHVVTSVSLESKVMQVDWEDSP